MLAYPSYLYLTQPLFLVWILGGFFLGTGHGQSILQVQRYAFLGAGYVDLEMGTHLLLTMTVVIGHRFTQARSLQDARQVLAELFASAVLCLNGLVYTSMAVSEWFLTRVHSREWVPMRKTEECLGWRRTAATLWPTTGLGLFGLVFGFLHAPSWALVALPFLISFALGIPMTFWTGQGSQPCHLVPCEESRRGPKTG